MRSTKGTEGGTVRLSIKTKLFLAVLLSVALLIAGIVRYVSLLAARSAEESVRRTISRSETALAARLSSRFSRIAAAGSALAADPGLRPRVYAGDSKALQARMADLEEQHQFDLLMVSDVRGLVLARSDKPDAVGSSAAGSPLFQAALRGEQSTGYMKRGSELLQIAALPVRDNAAEDIVRGSLAIAYLLTPELAEEIMELTGGEVLIYALSPQAESGSFRPEPVHGTRGELTAAISSYLSSSSELQAALESQEAPVLRQLEIADEEFLGSWHPLRTSGGRPVGLIVTLASRTAVLAPFRQIIKGCLIAGLLGLMLAGALAFGIAQGVASPLIELAGVTNRIRDGYFPPSTYRGRGDEVGVLQRAVHDMGRALKRKVELEEYLASFNEELEPVYAPPDEQQAPAGSTLEKTNGGSLPPGTIFDSRYRIEGLLGAGGMGRVYRARDVVLDEPIALKLLGGSTMSEVDEAAFKREIKLARKISHRNIVRTHDFGVAGGVYYISMEYAPGYTLRQFVDTHGPVELNIGLIMARQLCAALAEAHAQGVVHRDLKASNIIISRRGVLKIMDFGIAIAVQPHLEKPKSAKDEEPPSSGASETFGTPLYMAPEQFRGADQDQRVDIYAMGVLLFYLFSGRYPFTGASIRELAEKHHKAPVPNIRRIRAGLPRLLQEIIERALAKKRSERFESAFELSSALAAVPAGDENTSQAGTGLY